uniref:EF-hand domain-containing protein n=2 Tax=Macrostomum lignano TaxID=282301 RepID=A0A1I8HFI4_9PLAT
VLIVIRVVIRLVATDRLARRLLAAGTSFAAFAAFAAFPAASSALLTAGRRVRRGLQVAAIVDDLRAGQTPLQHLCGEIVVAAQIVEADNVVLDFLVLDDAQSRDDADAEAPGQEGRFLDADSHEFALNVARRQRGEVAVNNAAAEGRVPVEVAHQPLASHGLVKEVALLCELGQTAVPVGQPLVPLLGLFLQLAQPALPQPLQVVLVEVLQPLDLVVETLLDHLGGADHLGLQHLLQLRVARHFLSDFFSKSTCAAMAQALAMLDCVELEVPDVVHIVEAGQHAGLVAQPRSGRAVLPVGRLLQVEAARAGPGHPGQGQLHHQVVEKVGQRVGGEHPKQEAAEVSRPGQGAVEPQAEVCSVGDGQEGGAGGGARPADAAQAEQQARPGEEAAEQGVESDAAAAIEDAKQAGEDDDGQGQVGGVGGRVRVRVAGLVEAQGAQAAEHVHEGRVELEIAVAWADVIAGRHDALHDERHPHGVVEAVVLRQAQRRLQRSPTPRRPASLKEIAAPDEQQEQQPEQAVADVGEDAVERRDRAQRVRALEVVEADVLVPAGVEHPLPYCSLCSDACTCNVSRFTRPCWRVPLPAGGDADGDAASTSASTPPRQLASFGTTLKRSGVPTAGSPRPMLSTAFLLAVCRTPENSTFRARSLAGQAAAWTASRMQSASFDCTRTCTLTNLKYCGCVGDTSTWTGESRPSRKLGTSVALKLKRICRGLCDVTSTKTVWLPRRWTGHRVRDTTPKPAYSPDMGSRQEITSRCCLATTSSGNSESASSLSTETRTAALAPPVEPSSGVACVLGRLGSCKQRGTLHQAPGEIAFIPFFRPPSVLARRVYFCQTNFLLSRSVQICFILDDRLLQKRKREQQETTQLPGNKIESCPSYQRAGLNMRATGTVGASVPRWMAISAAFFESPRLRRQGLLLRSLAARLDRTQLASLGKYSCRCVPRCSVSAENIIVLIMGNSHGAFSKEELAEYQELTYLTKREIIEVYNRFTKIDPQALKEDARNPKVEWEKILAIPELRMNPFKERIVSVFSSEPSRMSFEDFLDMMSVFSEAADKATKILAESDRDEDRKLSFAEFEHVISKAPDFVSSFRIRV